MKKTYSILMTAVYCALTFLTGCSSSKNEPEIKEGATVTETKADYHGFESQVKWGEHLVTIAGCGDCHTPKKMTPQGMVEDDSLLLSGHPSSLPAPDVDRKAMEGKGNVVTNDLTAWVGPWGITYTANLTPDETGLGNWKEEQFIYALRNGVTKGLPGSRPILPPMPWFKYKFMTDDELKAVWAYLRSIKPIKNTVPAPMPPALASK